MANPFYSCGFGTARAGLSNVGVAAYNAGGVLALPRAVASELRAGSGDYGRSLALPESFVGYLEWDSGETSPVYLHENVNLAPPASGLSADDVTNALTSQGLTGARAARLDHLDADVSSRNAVAPDNSGIVAIRERTARLPDVPAAVGSAMRLDLTQAVPTSNSPNSVGDALNAARAQGFGSWRVIGGELHLYGPDGATIVQSFTLDNPASPSRRIAA